MECVLFDEVELVYVLMDRQSADIFTKPLGLDKLSQFLGALGLRHLDVPNLRRRKDHERELERSGSDREAESDEEFNFGLAQEAKGTNMGNKRSEEP